MLSPTARCSPARRARRRVALTPAVLAVTLLPGGRLAAQEPRPAPPGETAEGVVRHLYDLVTFPAGELPDWDAVRAAFIPEAVIVLRTGRTGTTVMSVDDFLADWHRFVDESDVETTGFREEITALVPLVFGDIAHVLVLYEASIPGRMPEPQEGVDSFHLIRRDGR
ncbi:MAG: hypothetical protein PVI57_23495, partial [Gemmatimonadota bacterium]